MTEINKKLDLAAIPPTNNDGDPYILPLDIYKEGYQAYNISNWFKGRVGDNGTPFAIRWYSHGRLLNIQGMRPFIEGQVGDYTIDDSDPDNVRIDMAEDASNIHIVGDVDDTQAGGVAIYRLINQAFPKSGIFYGKIGFMGTQDDGTLVNTGVDIVFKVLAGNMNMLGARKFYVTELEKALTEFQEKSAELQKDFQDKMDSNEQNFNARLNTELQNLQDHVNSYLSQYEGTVKYNIASLDHLASVASSIDAELKAADVANKQDFDNLKKDIATKLSQMQLTPTVVTNLQELSTKYPKGAMGVFVTADDGCIAYFDGSQWQKGAKFDSAALSLQAEKQINENNEVSKALLDQHNGRVIYSFHASESNTGWNIDNNYLRITKLPNGISQFIFSIKSQIGKTPIAVFAEKQDDGTYIPKSEVHLTTSTGNIDSTLINYNVNNDNTYLFLGGAANIFKFSTVKSDGTNPFVQLSAELTFNTAIKPMHDENTDPNLNFAGVDMTVIGLEPSNYAFISNYANNYLTSQSDKTSSHFWSIGVFQKGDYLTKMVLQSSDPNAVVEIREQINGKFILKKRIKPSSSDNQIFYLNYLAENDGFIFLHAVFNYELDNSGDLYQYDSPNQELELSPAPNLHRLLGQADIYKLKNPNPVEDLIGQIVSTSSEEASKNVLTQDILLFSNLNENLDHVANVKNHYWNAMDFHKGDFLSKAILQTSDPDAKVEIRENENNEFVLKKRVGISFINLAQGEADLNYTAQNDGILFVSGAVEFADSTSSEPLYEYDETDDPIHLDNPTGLKAFNFGIAVYSSQTLSDSIMNKTINKMNQDTEEKQNAKNQAKFANLSNLIPRLQPIDKSFSLLGRWYIKKISDENYYVTNNSGAQIYFKISNATYFDINWKQMHNPDYARWAYAIDEGDFNSISTSQTRVDIPNNDTHIVRIVTDAIDQDIGKWEGNGFAFNKVSTDGTFSGLTPVDPVIMYYGDSITEGIRTLGMDEKGPGCSVLHAYSWLSAKNLHAHPYIIGYGGTGLYNKGSFNTSDYSVDWMMQGVAEKEIQPNLIVVNIGTNDSAINDDGFKDLYKSFIHKLFLKYPGVPIACMIPFNQIHANPITEVVSETKDCFLISTQDWDLTFTDGTHPDQAGSVKAAYNLAKAIQEQIGNTWQSHAVPEQSMDLSKLNS